MTPPTHAVRSTVAASGALVSGPAPDPTTVLALAFAVALPMAGCVDTGVHDDAAVSWMGTEMPTLTPADTAVTQLAWHAPDEGCEQVYRIDVDYDTPPMNETDSVSMLAMGRHPRRDPGAGVLGALRPDVIFPGHMFYEGVRVGPQGTHRDVHLSRELVGPAAPTAACYERTWDPMEDALALGWPRLPGRLTAVRETWPGARVEGRCNKTACVDVDERSGSLAHDMECVTSGWRETLVGIYRMGEGHVAALESHWDDGHGTDGIWAERRALISVESGRPVWASATIHHGFIGMDRRWTLTAVDDCAGSPAMAGWIRPEALTAEATRVAQRYGETKKPGRKAKSKAKSAGKGSGG